MTGASVRETRESLRWTGPQLAALLGVHASTVSRWERQDVTRADPMQAQLLILLRTALRKDESLQDRLTEALAISGMRALYVLLSAVYAPGPLA